MSSNEYVRSSPSMDLSNASLDQAWTSSALALLQRSFDFAEHMQVCVTSALGSQGVFSEAAVPDGVPFESVEPTVFHSFLGGVGSLISTTVQYSITNFYCETSTAVSKPRSATLSTDHPRVLVSGRERLAQERDRLQRSNNVVRQITTSLMSLYLPVLLGLSSPSRRTGNAARASTPACTESIVESTTKITRVGLMSFLSPNVLHILNDLETRSIDQGWYQTLLRFSLQSSLGIWSLLCMASGNGVTYWNSRWTALHQLAYETRIRQIVFSESIGRSLESGSEVRPRAREDHPEREDE